jgi:hypothetical protein
VLLYLWRPRDAAPGTPPSLGELSTRTLLGGLSAGVGLGGEWQCEEGSCVG